MSISSGLPNGTSCEFAEKYFLLLAVAFSDETRQAGRIRFPLPKVVLGDHEVLASILKVEGNSCYV